jgi:D-hydroxyproline dehydrogenase
VTAQSYLVIGGGIVGAASALRLKAAGFDVTLIDPGDPRRGASFGNIGHIAAEQTEPLASREMLLSFPKKLYAFGGPLDFRFQDARLWAPWALRFAAACDGKTFARGAEALGELQSQTLDAWQRLAALAGAPHLVKASGHAVVWMSAGKADEAMAAWRRAKIGSTRFRDMTRVELAAYGGVMRQPPAAGIVFSGTGQFSEPQAVRDGLLASFAQRGGVIAKGQVMRVVAGATSVVATLEDGRTLTAGGALISCGAWSPALMQQLGATAPVIAERGYSIQSGEHRWPETLLSTVFEERSMVITRFTSGLRASSFLELGDPDAPGDPRKWRWLQEQLRDLGVAFSATPDRWVGPRPTLPDYLPAIGRLERSPSVLYAFGHQHLGMTLAAVTSELIEALATGAPAPVDMAAFRVERFA